MRSCVSIAPEPEETDCEKPHVTHRPRQCIHHEPPARAYGPRAPVAPRLSPFKSRPHTAKLVSPDQVSRRRRSRFLTFFPAVRTYLGIWRLDATGKCPGVYADEEAIKKNGHFFRIRRAESSNLQDPDFTRLRTRARQKKEQEILYHASLVKICCPLPLGHVERDSAFESFSSGIPSPLTPILANRLRSL